MEAAVVSMALKIVGNKIAPLLREEYTSIVGVQRDLEDLKNQVVQINGWLETRYDTVQNDPSFNWLKRLKDVAYAADDVVDEFQLKAEKHAAAADGGGIISKYMCRKPKSFIFQCKVASKIKKIRKRFDEIVKLRKDYNAITNCISGDPPVRQTNMKTWGTSSCPDVDVSSVVGRDEDKKHIISKLLETDHQLKIKIISVIGLGGSGKTTLSKLVFSDGNIKEHFDSTLWVHVSQKFDVSELVQKMFEAFADNIPGQHDMPSMKKTISDKLDGKRFLLVLDDVWTESQLQWEEFWEFLINVGAPGSRILLTTRSSKVAKTVGSTYQFLLQLLSAASSWQLFMESCRFTANDLDSEFHDVGKQIVDKCGGVPLAIKVLAGVLRGKEQIDQWKAMRDSNLLYFEGEEHRVAACLRLSYFHLPSNLKHCFTICSVFPKGHKIDKEKLIDLWIAHDMITLEDPSDYLDLEYVGHKHFNSLSEVSFLQNVEEEDGRVTCGMHDLVHDLALSIVGDEISLDMPNDATSITKSYRYFSLTKQPKKLVTKNIFKKARVVYMQSSEEANTISQCKSLVQCHGGDITHTQSQHHICKARRRDYTYVMALKHAKHLRSVMVGYLDAKEANTISQVKYLKYLAMSLRSCETLPEGLSNVWSLQSLQVTKSYSLVEIPESICKLKMLRTLNFSGCRRLKSLPYSIGDCQMISSIDLSNCWGLTVLPDSIGKLQKLTTLNLPLCIELKCLPDSIGDCQMISNINLWSCSKLELLPDSIGKLHKLSTLKLSRCVQLKCLPDSIGDCQMISSIYLWSCSKLTALPDSIGKLQKLRTLNLSLCQELKSIPDSIGDCQMISSIDLSTCTKLTVLPDSIGRNEKLRVLRLRYTKLKRLPSIITTLRNLECLDLLGCSKLVELPEAIGNMEKLRVLNLEDCKELAGMPVGIGQLSRLQKLGLFVVGMGEKFAGISELSNVPRIGEALTIRGISHVMDPKEAQACLKQKTNLQRLGLNWMSNKREQVNTELQQDVLDGLEPPPGIKELEIHGYSGGQYARWMQIQVGVVRGLAPFPVLRVMKLYNFPNLQDLHGLVELPCLELLVLKGMPSLESISGGPFPSLVKLKMEELPRLGELWMVAEGTMPDGEEGGCCCNFTPQLGQVRVGNCLTELEISYCPKLEVKSHLPPSLKNLQLWRSEQVLQSLGQRQGSSLHPDFSHLKNLQLYGAAGLGSGHGWELLQHMTALESLEIQNFSGVQTKLPESLRSLTSLRFLKVSCVLLPESLGELTSLQELVIESCEALEQSLDCLGELCSLRKLRIDRIQGLTCFPESICRLTTSLQELVIYGCEGIKSLPEGIKDLTALQSLLIVGCYDLVRRCKKGTGEDWHLISHIPRVSIEFWTGLEFW